MVLSKSERARHLGSILGKLTRNGAEPQADLTLHEAARHGAAEVILTVVKGIHEPAGEDRLPIRRLKHLHLDGAVEHVAPQDAPVGPQRLGALWDKTGDAARQQHGPTYQQNAKCVFHGSERDTPLSLLQPELAYLITCPIIPEFP